MSSKLQTKQLPTKPTAIWSLTSLKLVSSPGKVELVVVSASDCCIRLRASGDITSELGTCGNQITHQTRDLLCKIS